MLQLAGIALALGLFACVAVVDVSDTEKARREAMVRDQIERRGVRDPRVLAAMRAVPRHAFVPSALRAEAYEDEPLPIGHGQTISQPYIVALMTELARLDAGAKVLEIGTGSGYQAAVLACVAREVYSIEILAPLAETAATRLRELGYSNVEVRAGDGYRGWPDEAPFDAILLTAAPTRIPPALLEQLAPGGRLVAPVGDRDQDLVVVTRTESGFVERVVLPVRFVPMTGEAQRGQ
jgi:protein-L-isoaspartate(D-aspartate) O-methyltransferase